MSANPNEQASESLIGKQLGKYTLVRVLATGGMARIYEAEEKTLGRLVAVKVLEQDRLRRDASLSKRFEREAQSIARLEHDHIIPIYDYGEQDGVYYMAMRLVRGKDLSRELSKLRRNGELMPVERTLRILGQVASAIDFAHEQNIIHRDIKPSNILLDQNDKAILTDFGLVMHQKTDATLGTAFGTPRYISPEQAMASNTAVPQSDIYSLATILYEALTGVTPFDGDSPMQIAMSQISDPPPPPRTLNPDIPESVERELLRALDKEPENRHKTAGELISAVRRGYGVGLDATPMLAAQPPAPAKADAKAEIKVETAKVEPVKAALPPKTPPDRQKSKAPAKRRGASPVVLIVLLLLLAGGAALLLNPGLLGSLTGQDTPQTGGNATPPAGGLTDPLALAVAATAESAATAEPMGDLTEEPTATNTASPTPNIAFIRLIYNDIGFVMVNTGNYTLNTAGLMFVRGAAGSGDDDVNGSVFPLSQLPGGDCMRIVLQGRRVNFDDGCPQIVHGEIFPPDANFFFWRSDPVDAATFTVSYNGETVTTCDTVPRGGAGECSFNWVVPGD